MVIDGVFPCGKGLEDCEQQILVGIVDGGLPWGKPSRIVMEVRGFVMKSSKAE